MPVRTPSWLNIPHQQHCKPARLRAFLAVALLAAALSGAVSAQQAANRSNGLSLSGLCLAEFALALSAVSAEQDARHAVVRVREEDLRLVELGLSASVSVSGGLEVGADLRKHEDAAVSPSLEVDGGLSYQFDEIATVRARISLHTAIVRAEAQERTDVLEALISLSRLRTAKRAVVITEQAAAEAEELAASANQSAALAKESSGSAELDAEVALDLRELELAAARAREAADRAAAEVAQLEEGLQALGITAATQGAAAEAHCLEGALAGGDLAPPQLPAPLQSATPEHARLRSGLELARAQALRAGLSPLRGLTLNARYNEGGNRVTAEVGVKGGKPEVGVAYRWRDVEAHNWTVGLAATFRLESGVQRVMEAATSELSAAEAALAAYEAAFAGLVWEEQAKLEVAWRRFTLAAEAASIARARYGLATDERAATRTEGVLNRALDALERDYQAYLRALNRYLTEFGLSWTDLP